jgi:hypothetical protein
MAQKQESTDANHYHQKYANYDAEKRVRTAAVAICHGMIPL